MVETVAEMSHAAGRIVRRAPISNERVVLGVAEVSAAYVAPVQAPNPEIVLQLQVANESIDRQRELTKRLETELEATQRELRELRAELQAAREDAVRRGFQEGRVRGESEARKSAEEAVSEWSRAAQGVANEFDKQLQKLRAEVADLVIAGVCKVLGDQALSMQAIRAAADQAMQEAGIGAPLRILLAPFHVEQLARLAPQVLAAWRDRRIEVVGDARVAHGGCILEAPDGIVDARLEVQLERLRTVLTQHYGNAGAP